MPRDPNAPQPNQQQESGGFSGLLRYWSTNDTPDEQPRQAPRAEDSEGQYNR
jgi:hypothetical protein